MRFLAGAVLCLLACTVRRAPPATGSSEEDALRSAVARYYRDMSARDWAAYRAHFWPHATLTTVWRPPGEAARRVVVTTIDEFLAQTARGPDSKPVFEERLLGQDVRLSGSLAQVWARYETRFGDSSAVATWRGIDAFTWMKHNGSWRIVSVAYADEPGQSRGAP
ncbi:MAG TPA: nuclear transport factor 2 family protein [Gemmatimonadales bacterium]|jgi:hypothetical protein